MRIQLVFLALLASTASLPVGEEANPLPGILNDPEYINPEQDRIIAERATFPASADEFLEQVQKAANFSKLVYNGDRAQPGQFPQQVYITYASRKGGNYICGGTLISTTHVLTAGHCTEDMAPPARIMVGSTNIYDQSANAQRRNIHRIYNYQGYQPPSTRNDIAIVEFSPAVTLNRDVKLAKIATDDTELLKITVSFVSGYGTYTYRGNQSISSPNLLWSQINLYSFRYCQNRWQNRLIQSQICAGAKELGAGPGDSGGPLQVSYNGELYQVGLTSYGTTDIYDDQHNQDRFPTVFTRVSSYCDFISQSTSGAAQCQDVSQGGNPGGNPGGNGCNTPPPTRPPVPTRPTPPPNCNHYAEEYKKGLEYIYENPQ